ncbi:MAG: hypothetical protein M4579_002641 [Chaenotheca gracillima]|nr:MAG: hypothetical protein M4579_002641 [Chaenotheca gracillima]
MKRQLRQSGAGVCQLCEHLLSQRQTGLNQIRRFPRVSVATSPSISAPCIQQRRSTFTKRGDTARNHGGNRPPIAKAPQDVSSTAKVLGESQLHPSLASDFQPDALDASSALEATKKILRMESVPPEQAIIEALGPVKLFADRIAAISDLKPPKSEQETTPNASLLSLEESSPTGSKPALASTSETHHVPVLLKEEVDAVSGTIVELMMYPPVFITPNILNIVVDIQTLLQRPQTLPRILSLYANKPMPHPNTTPIKFSNPDPNKAQFAVPLPTASAALQSAITLRDLSLCLSIIYNTVATPSFRNNKFLRKGLVPCTALAVAPVAGFAVATRLSELQNTMDPQTATAIAFGGIVTYLGATVGIGLVALTTSNDQMNRVTWAQGIPLRQRWLREEERAALDQVAAAWGFREVERRGEEEGEEWLELKEWIGTKGMILDRVELMEGME